MSTLDLRSILTSHVSEKIELRTIWGTHQGSRLEEISRFVLIMKWNSDLESEPELEDDDISQGPWSSLLY